MKRLVGLVAVLAALVLVSTALGWAGETRAQAVTQAAGCAARITFIDRGVPVTTSNYTGYKMQKEISMFEHHSYTVARARYGSRQVWRVAWPKAWLISLGTDPADATPYYVSAAGC